MEVFKRFTKSDPPPGKKVKTCEAGDAFGELALLYNCPRAATCITSSNCVLWELDRDTFNHIVKDAAAKKRQLHEGFLSQVDILKTMDQYERSKIADALKTEVFRDKDLIIRQGDAGNKFYIIEEGSAIATIDNKTVLSYKTRDYFGELALLKDQPRQANVIAQGPVKCVTLDRRSFKRLLGPMENVLKRDAAKYTQYMRRASEHQ